MLKRIGLIALMMGVGVAAAGCSDGYGYGGLNAGVGYADGGYYGDGYGDGYAGYGYDGYGAGYAPSYFGWYNDFYYPGTGGYVYDRYRRQYRWNDTQRRYWQGRTVRGGRQNWGGFADNGSGNGYRGNEGGPNPAYRGTQGNRTYRQNGVPGQPAYGDRRGPRAQSVPTPNDAAAAQSRQRSYGGDRRGYRGGGGREGRNRNVQPQ